MIEADRLTSNKLPQPPALSDRVLQRRRTSGDAGYVSWAAAQSRSQGAVRRGGRRGRPFVGAEVRADRRALIAQWVS